MQSTVEHRPAQHPLFQARKVHGCRLDFMHASILSHAFMFTAFNGSATNMEGSAQEAFGVCVMNAQVMVFGSLVTPLQTHGNEFLLTVQTEELH